MIDGLPWARPPSYLDPDRRLVRNTFHDNIDRAATAFGAQLGFDLDEDPGCGVDPGDGSARPVTPENDVPEDRSP